MSILPFLAAATSHAATIWQIGLDDDTHITVASGGGLNAAFVQEAGTNDLPGVPNSPAVDVQADDDYYLAGVYNTAVDGGAYTPVGDVLANEEAAERAFPGTDNTLRYHSNLPNFL